MAVTLKDVIFGFVGYARSVTIPIPLLPERRRVNRERDTCQAENFSQHVVHR